MDRLDELALFLSIADAGSLAAAARLTRRSPPSVTRILGTLEARLGVRLAERTTRRLVLTDAGLRLVEHARRLVADFDDSMRDIAGEGAAPSGRLRISAPLTFGRMQVMPIVMAFLDAYPQTMAELSLEDRPIDLVEEGIDLAVRIAHLDSSSLVARRVGAVRRVVVASRHYLKRHGWPADPDDLSAHAIVLFANQANGPLWQFQSTSGVRRHVRVDARLQVNRAEAAIAAACDGKGIVQVLSYQVAAELARGRLVRLLQEFEQPPIPVHIVFSTRRLMAPRVRAFLDFAVPRLVALPVLRGN